MLNTFRDMVKQCQDQGLSGDGFDKMLEVLN